VGWGLEVPDAANRVVAAELAEWVYDPFHVRAGHVHQGAGRFFPSEHYPGEVAALHAARGQPCPCSVDTQDKGVLLWGLAHYGAPIAPTLLISFRPRGLAALRARLAARRDWGVSSHAEFQAGVGSVPDVAAAAAAAAFGAGEAAAAAALSPLLGAEEEEAAGGADMLDKDPRDWSKAAQHEAVRQLAAWIRTYAPHEDVAPGDAVDAKPRTCPSRRRYYLKATMSTNKHGVRRIHTGARSTYEEAALEVVSALRSQAWLATLDKLGNPAYALLQPASEGGESKIMVQRVAGGDGLRGDPALDAAAALARGRALGGGGSLMTWRGPLAGGGGGGGGIAEWDGESTDMARRVFLAAERDPELLGIDVLPRWRMDFMRRRMLTPDAQGQPRFQMVVNEVEGLEAGAPKGTPAESLYFNAWHEAYWRLKLAHLAIDAEAAAAGAEDAAGGDAGPGGAAAGAGIARRRG
jgi:hypothetical protein